jgi:hypothetical protein
VPIISATQKLKQEDYKFKASLGYIVRPDDADIDDSGGDGGNRKGRGGGKKEANKKKTTKKKDPTICCL